MEGHTFPIPDELASVIFGTKKTVFEESIVAFTQSGLVAEGKIRFNPATKSCSILKFNVKQRDNDRHDKVYKSEGHCTAATTENSPGDQAYFEKKRDETDNVQSFASSMWGSEKPKIESHISKEQMYSNVFLESRTEKSKQNIHGFINRYEHKYKFSNEEMVQKPTNTYPKANDNDSAQGKCETDVAQIPTVKASPDVMDTSQKLKCDTTNSLQRKSKGQVKASSNERLDSCEDVFIKKGLNALSLKATGQRNLLKSQVANDHLQITPSSDITKTNNQCPIDSEHLDSSAKKDISTFKENKSETLRNHDSSEGLNNVESDENWDLRELMDPFDEIYPDLSTEESLYENVKLFGENKRTRELFKNLIMFADSNGFEMKDTSPTGNCMFQSINDQLQINGDFRFDVYTLRYLTVKYLENHPTDPEGTHLECFLDEPWTTYLKRMAQPYEWGDHLVLKALCEVLQRNILVINVTSDENTSHHEFSPKANDVIRNETLNLGHLGEFHYVSLRPKLWKQKWITAALRNIQIEDKNVYPHLSISNRSNIENHLISHLAEVDPISKIPVPHLSFAITQLIEESDICYLQIPSKLVRSNDNDIVTAGGRSDGTEVFIMQRDKIKHAAEYWDRYSSESPFMMVYLRDSKLEVLCDNRTTPLPLEQIRAEIGDTHPGYCTLRFFGKRELLLTALDIKVEGGPEYPGRAVAAYHCPTWPAVAKEWLERNSKWPTVGLKKKIEKCGCFVAKRPHAKSKNPIYEWQFIFNDAEKLLVKEGLTKSQLYVYDIFKSCLDYHSKHLQFKLGTVHVKSTFFYVCEMINDDTFEESPGVCFIYLAGTLLTNLMRRDVPNYFIRNNNMIDHFKDDDIENLVQILEAIRFFPLHCLGLMMDGRGYNRSGIIDIIQRDSESYRKEMDLNKAFCNLFFPMMIRQACKIAKTSRYRKVYEKIRDARLLLVLAPMENETPVYVPSLGNLIKQSLKDFDDKTVDLVATEMEESINNHNSVRKIKYLTGGRDVGGFGEINIPSYIADNAFDEATILNTYGVILHNADRNYEDASTYYSSALDRLECKSFEEDDSRAEGNKCSMRSPHEQFEHDGLTLKIFRNIFNSGVLEKLRPRMTFLEKVCLRMKNTEYVDFVMEAWEKLGNPDRAAEFHSSFLEHLNNT